MKPSRKLSTMTETLSQCPYCGVRILDCGDTDNINKHIFDSH